MRYMTSDDLAARLRLYANASIEGSWSAVFRLDLTIAADEIERLSAELVSTTNRLTAERDEARLQTGRILNEIDCRIEHGADSNGHLEAIRNLFTPADIEAHEVRGDVAGPEGAD